jgi:hypothetical protein
MKMSSLVHQFKSNSTIMEKCGIYTTRTRCSTDLDNIWMAGNSIHYSSGQQSLGMELTEPSYNSQYPGATPTEVNHTPTRTTRDHTPLLRPFPDTRPLSHPTFGHLLWQNIPVVPVSFQDGGDLQPLFRCSSVFLRGDQCLPLGSFGSLPQMSVLARNTGEFYRKAQQERWCNSS